MPSTKKSQQSIVGSYNAQASGPGAQANVEITQQIILEETAATAPAAPYHFVGRKSDLDTLKGLIKQKETLSIALQGMGGIGKTATVLKLASELQDYFTGGIFWGSLPDHNGDANRILRTWARICGQDVSDEKDLNVVVSIVRGLLSNRRSLKGPLIVIIDDVQDDWLLAIKLIQQAIPNNIPLLFTTRDEILADTLGARIHHLDALLVKDAISLLMQLTSKALIEQELHAAEELLFTIGYLPLAIELMGKRIATMSRKPGFKIEYIEKEVKDRASSILSLPGHPGLAATFAITYEDLSADEQRLFRWLGIFTSAPLDLESVSGVLSLDVQTTDLILDRLVQVALLNWGKTEKTYTMHPLLRQYGRTLLSDSGEIEQAEVNHLSYYLDLAKRDYHIDPAARFGIRFPDPSESKLTPEEQSVIYSKLTGLSGKFQKEIDDLERVGKIDLARVCYVVNQGIWSVEQAEMIALGSQNPMNVLGGLSIPIQRHLYVHDILYARAAVLGGMLDEELSNSRSLSSPTELSNIGNNKGGLKIEFDGKLFLKKYLCSAPIQLPWLSTPTKIYSSTAGIPFYVLIRARDLADMQLHLESDLLLAKQVRKDSELLFFLALPFDFELLPATFMNSIMHMAQNEKVVFLICPESIVSLDDDASRRLARTRTLRK